MLKVVIYQLFRLNLNDIDLKNEDEVFLPPKYEQIFGLHF